MVCLYLVDKFEVTLGDAVSELKYVDLMAGYHEISRSIVSQWIGHGFITGKQLNIMVHLFHAFFTILNILQ